MDNVTENGASDATGNATLHDAQAHASGTKDVSPPAPNRMSRRARLTKLMGTHALVAVAAMALFAAADSWSVVSGLGIATLLSVITGALAGITISTLIHEWFHYAGARYVGAAFDIPERQGLFLYDWDFAGNSVRQFLVMSVAGSVGGLVALLLLWNAVPADSWGRAALRSGVIASIVFAALIEWPIIKRVRNNADPLTELAKIDQALLSRCFTIAGLAGVVLTVLFAP